MKELFRLIVKAVIGVCVLLGKSLLWVAILGLIVFYIYALISFALLRSSFDPDNELFCATLWQCTITVVRYGLVGDLFDVSGSYINTVNAHITSENCVL